jgi:nucleoside-diphosphate-sugar epimerase
MKALVIGGTGPTGPHILQGLCQRGYAVTMLHRGYHNNPLVPSGVRRIYADPHFRETLETALAGEFFDVVIATYGRLRLVATALLGKTPRFIGVGGMPVYRGMLAPQVNFPTGMPILTSEDDAVAQSEADARFAYLIAQTEEAIMQSHQRGDYNVTFFRYPMVYGPYQVIPLEWSVIRRILDRRPFLMLPDGGLTLLSRGYAQNMAHAVLLAVDQPIAAAGQIYNCADERLLSLHQWAEIITRTLDYTWEILCLPDALAHPARPLIPLGCSAHHACMDISKIRQQLGYRDVVPVEEALAATVHWYVAHPPARGGDLEQKLLDPFNYAAEDHLAQVWKESVQRLAAVPFENVQPYHPYAHPKAPGQPDHRQR